MSNNIKEFKSNIDFLLMLLGFLVFIFVSLYTIANNIPTVNTWAGFISMVMYSLPFCWGLWIFSKRRVNKYGVVGKIIRVIIIIYCVIYMGSFIVFLFIKLLELMK